MPRPVQPEQPVQATYPLTPDEVRQDVDYQMGKDRADLANMVDRKSNTVRNNVEYANKLSSLSACWKM
jgi:hypothetical protein